MKLEIEKVLVLSTGHITKSDMELLQSKKECGLIVYDTEFWTQVFLGQEMVVKDLEVSGFSREFISILTWCQSFAPQQLDYVKFDADGPVIEGWRVFDW